MSRFSICPVSSYFPTKICRHFYPTRAANPDHLIPLHLTVITFRLYKLRNSCSSYGLHLPLTVSTFINTLLSVPDKVAPQAKHMPTRTFVKTCLCMMHFIGTVPSTHSCFKIVTFHRFYPHPVAGTHLSGHQHSANPNHTYKLYPTVSRASHSVCLSLSLSLSLSF